MSRSTTVPGQWVVVEVGDEVACAECGTVRVGRIGPRGGQTWMWQLPDGTRVCKPSCGETRAAIADIESDHEEEQAVQWAREQGYDA